MSPAAAETSALCCILAFNPGNQLAVRRLGSKAGLAFTGTDLAMATARLESAFPQHTPPAEYFSVAANDRFHRVFFAQVDSAPADSEIAFHALDDLSGRTAMLSPSLAAILGQLEPHLIEIPYLHLGENDFIYKFRPEKERNTSIYAQDPLASALYQSRLCAAIKALARQQERSAAAPVTLDFGAVHHVIPSHFGFCLGVKNAIERAYETLAENPGRRVFMLSELIHNPFVNEDLLRRGLRYLQTDRGVPYTTDGRTAPEVSADSSAMALAGNKQSDRGGPRPPGAVGPAIDAIRRPEVGGHLSVHEIQQESGFRSHGHGSATEGRLLWDTLTPDDIVITPAFGATDEDKARLVRKGIPVCQYDATCMLVEKVWKAARAYGREGYTVIIHGKHEHEETKATFSNTRRHAQAVIVRNLEETRQLGALIASDDPDIRAQFYELFAGRHTSGFDVNRHLERIAVVNQTTLLMNETLAIIEHLRGVYRTRYGDDTRVGGSSRRDTLCYATQVNQDALSRALAEPLDAAFVIGGRNSSNTYQLFRLCEQRLGAKAFFIQSEHSILSRDTVEHYVYSGGGQGRTEPRPLWPSVAKPMAGRPTVAEPSAVAEAMADTMAERRAGDSVVAGTPGDLAPKRVLVTGGASCPDGIIQQVITRINGFFPVDQLRTVDDVLRDLSAA